MALRAFRATTRSWPVIEVEPTKVWFTFVTLSDPSSGRLFVTTETKRKVAQSNLRLRECDSGLPLVQRAVKPPTPSEVWLCQEVINPCLIKSITVDGFMKPILIKSQAPPLERRNQPRRLRPQKSQCQRTKKGDIIDSGRMGDQR
jgi:hypothetical protein